MIASLAATAPTQFLDIGGTRFNHWVSRASASGSGNRGDVSAGWLPDDVASIDEEVDAGHE